MSDDTPTQRFGAPDEEPPVDPPLPRRRDLREPDATQALDEQPDATAAAPGPDPAPAPAAPDTDGIDDVDAMSQWFQPTGGITEVQPTVPPSPDAPSDPLSWLNDGRRDDATTVFPADAAGAGVGGAAAASAFPPAGSDDATTRFDQYASVPPRVDQYAATTAVGMAAAEGEPAGDGRSKRLIIILGAAGAVLLAAIITLLVIALGGGGTPVAEATDTPEASDSATPSATPSSASPTPSETPTPTPSPTKTEAPPPAAPTVSAFTAVVSTKCTSADANWVVTLAWTTTNASAVKIVGEGGASATGIGSSNTTLQFPCSLASQTFSLTATGPGGTASSSPVGVDRGEVPAVPPADDGQDQ